MIVLNTRNVQEYLVIVCHLTELKLQYHFKSVTHLFFITGNILQRKQPSKA